MNQRHVPPPSRTQFDPKMPKMVHMIIYNVHVTHVMFYEDTSLNIKFKKYLNVPLVFAIIIFGE